MEYSHLGSRQEIIFHAYEEMVKGNQRRSPPLRVWALAAAAAAAALALIAVAGLEQSLPEPKDRSHPSDQFIAEIAHGHLVNLTSIGPRVAGSFENEVTAVSLLVQTLKEIARGANKHHRVEIDVQRSSGGFPLSFLDGMNNVYRDVQSVVARLSAAGGGGGPGGGGAARGPALLLNCHFDTVPDSPGASDDAAGCAVLLEVLRALAASRSPLRHPVVFLLNGAEENIMQASHGFITQHKWARQVRAFINIEACGAGGRELLFQATPFDPWILEVYSGAVPHPFASSLAQEIFESGLVPGDTDFRIFRDFGNVSGVDLAWLSNGYVYHTRLDTARRVPLGSLQRTGDNVLALATGLVSHPHMEAALQRTAAVVYFDVLGAHVVCVRAHVAALLAALLLAACGLRVHLNARDAARQLYLRRGEWWRLAGGALLQLCGAHAAGLAAALAVAGLLHAVGARLSWYNTVPLLAPLYAFPAVGVTWLAWLALAARGSDRLAGAGGWWAARAAGDAAALGWAALLAAALLLRLRSGYLPAAWCAAAAVDVLATLLRVRDGWRAALWCCSALLPMLQTWYLLLSCLALFVPVMGRAGAVTPPDLAMALLVGVVTLLAATPLLPLVRATHRPHAVIYVLLSVCAATTLLVAVTPLGTAYQPARPQRFMLFHTRRTDHTGSVPSTDLVYWSPDLDANAQHSLRQYAEHGIPTLFEAHAMTADECAARLYCGAPYYLPVLTLLPHAAWIPAPAPPRPRLDARLVLREEGGGRAVLHATLTGPSHMVVIVSPRAGASLPRTSLMAAPPLPGPRWRDRDTYFFMLHDAATGGQPANWTFTVDIQTEDTAGAGAPWAAVSVAGHALFGADMRAPPHAALRDAFPEWTQVSGWGVDLHLYNV